MATYKIHPGIGIARLGNSDTEFYLAPETPAGLPMECDEQRQSALRSGRHHARSGHHVPRRDRAASSARRRASRSSSTTRRAPRAGR